MVGLTDAGSNVINALIEAHVAWQSPAQIAATICLDQEVTTDILCELDLAGWVDVWDSAEGPLITLSVLAAERLALRLVEVGAGQVLRWARNGDPDPPPQRARNVCAGEEGAKLGFALDASISPDLAAERFETILLETGKLAVSGRQPSRFESLPRPTQLLGLGLTPWPGPDHGATPLVPCPACKSRRLAPQMYCLYCDRWGFDRLVQAIEPVVSIPLKPTRSPQQEQELRDKERARRKAKRKRRHQRQTEATRKSNPKATFGSAPSQVLAPKTIPGPPPRLSQPPTSRENSSSASR